MILDNKLDFLSEPAEADTAPVVETAVETTAPESPSAEGRARGADGKFVSPQPSSAVASAPAAQADTPAIPPASAQPEAAQPAPGHVPISALMDERDRRKAAEDQVRQFQQRQAPPPAVPDPVEDPQGWQAHQANLIDAAEWKAVTSISQLMANKEHGAEAVSAAAQAFAAEAAQKPWLWRDLRQQPHPYEWTVNWHRRHQAVSNDADLDAFIAWKAGQSGQPPAQPVAAAAPAAPARPAPAAPPPSISSAPGAGGLQHVPSGPGQAFGAVFTK